MIIRLFARCFPSPLCILCAVSLLFIASSAKHSLAQPSGETGDPNLPETHVILVLDNSGSMKRNDPGFAIKDAVSGFAAGLAENSKLAIILFDTKARVILELTKVSEADFGVLLRRALSHINYRGQFTDIPGGLELALNELGRNRAPIVDSVVVFLTDGIVDLGSQAKNLERSRYLRDNLLPEIKQQGIRVYGVALTKAADLQVVQNLSSETRGDYHPVLGASEIFPAFQKINSQLRAMTDIGGIKEDIKPDATVEPEQQERMPVPETGQQEMKPDQPSGMESAPIEPPPEQAPEPEIKPEQIPELEITPKQIPELPEITQPEEPIKPSESPTEPGPQISGDAQESLYDRVMSGWVLIPVMIVIFGVILIAFIRFRRPKVVDKVIAKENKSNTYLVDIHANTVEDKTYPLSNGPIRIGRARRMNDIVIDQSTISSEHAIIEFRDGKYYLRDLNSTNGTFVNDRRIGKVGVPNEVCLENYDLISIARYKFRFRSEEPVKDDRSSAVPGFGAGTVMMPTVLIPRAMGSGQEKSLDETLVGNPARRCPNHPDAISNGVCAVCMRAYCARCVGEKDGHLLCEECRRLLA